VREDAIKLFGFASEEERAWFAHLQTIPGVGAKVALGILDAMPPEALADAIALQDKAAFARANGVGPKLAARLATELGLTPRLQDPDLAVAKGAALYAFEETYRRLVREGAAERAEEMAVRAGLSAEQQKQIAGRQIRTVASHAFGIVVVDRETGAENVAHLVHANDELPAAKTEDFFTVYDDQTSADIRVMEQAGVVESGDLIDNTEIATGEIRVPPGKKAGWPIGVTFALDSSGLLNVTAVEKETGEKLELKVDVGGMSEEEVERSRKALSRVQVS
jgi:molecular chaperone DnaK (HSP70)